MTRVDRRVGAAVFVGVVGSVSMTAGPAAAHVGRSDLLGDGFLHPLLGVDHLLAMVTVGLVAVFLVRPVRVPATFLAAMASGGALGIAGMSLPFGETAIALSVVALGGALVASRAIRPGAAVGLVAVAGFVHGHAHGIEAPSTAHPAIYVTGFLLATAALHFAGVGVGFGIRNRPGTRAAIGAGVLGAGIGLVVGVI
jgi:urease accessory protein